MKNKVMLITYPDCMGNNLKDLKRMLDMYFAEAISGVHILPFFPSSGDRGFAPINYKQVEPDFGDWGDIKELAKDYELMFDFMEDYAIDIMLGKDSSARSIRLDLPKFTLVGATTRAGLLTAPLRDRFGVIQRLEFYTPKELTTIILRSAKALGVEVDASGAAEIAKRSRGTPRLANRLLKRVRDFAQVKYDGRITREVADFALDILDVDKLGLDQNDRNILLMMIEKFDGGPVGLDTLAAALGEDPGTLEDVYEPYLLMNGLINRTPRGRMATEHAYRHLGIAKEI